MRNLEPTGKMDEATWVEMTKKIDPNQPVLVSYTITKEDAKGLYKALPSDAESRSKLKALGYESIQEMLGERFHMDVAYLKKLNPNKNSLKARPLPSSIQANLLKVASLAWSLIVMIKSYTPMMAIP